MTLCSNNWLHFLNLIVFSYFKNTGAVPPDYCLTALNRSDCRVAPTPVFTYYKPGSRCEIQMWRGCPTQNMFENEYLCSLNCIFRMKVQTELLLPSFPSIYDIDCHAEFDDGKCSDVSVPVYYNTADGCKEGTWHGCPNVNMFESENSCSEFCFNDTSTELAIIYDILKDLTDEEKSKEATTAKSSESGSHESTTEAHTTTTETEEPTTNDEYEEVINTI